MIEGKRVLAGEAILGGLTTDRDGNERAVEEIDEIVRGLVREHSRLVYRIAYAVLRSHHDAEDATQETFLRVLRYRSKLAAVENPKAWLARIAWRTAVDRRKKQQPSQEIPLNDPGNQEIEITTPDAAADLKLDGIRLGAALEKLIAALPTKLREPLVLSTIEDMTPREVAATLGLNEAAVRSRIFRARQILKGKLAQQIGVKQVAHD